MASILGTLLPIGALLTFINFHTNMRGIFGGGGGGGGVVCLLLAQCLPSNHCSFSAF